MIEVFMRPSGPGRIDHDLFVIDRPENSGVSRRGDVWAYLAIESGQIVWKQFVFEEGMDLSVIKPIITMPEAHKLIGAFVNLAKSMDMKMPTEEHMKGQLDAKEMHLQDLRRLVFKGKV